jgi:hypothetical protein
MNIVMISIFHSTSEHFVTVTEHLRRRWHRSVLLFHRSIMGLLHDFAGCVTCSLRFQLLALIQFAAYSLLLVKPMFFFDNASGNDVARLYS